MKSKVIFFLLCVFVVMFINAEGAWMGSFSQRGPATHELKSGELVASHPSLPLRTKVKVTNLQNRKQVEVIITGRIVPSGNRIIDLSQGAAAALGMAAKGVTAVSVESIRERPGN
jgi:rare lipoprotein A